MSYPVISFAFEFDDTTISRDLTKLVLAARRSLCTAMHCQGHP